MVLPSSPASPRILRNPAPKADSPSSTNVLYFYFMPEGCAHCRSMARVVERLHLDSIRGVGDKLDVFFDNSPVFRLRPDAAMKGVKPVAWFDSDKPLRSGWAWGQKYLQDGVAIAEARVGKGKLFLFGPEITFRAQPHGTFKFLFNGIYYSAVMRN